MTAEFQRLPMGMCNCYLVKQECVVLVDAGPPNRGRILRQRLESLSIAPEKVRSLERLKISEALSVTSPRIDPVVPPLPICSAPPLMVVPSV